MHRILASAFVATLAVTAFAGPASATAPDPNNTANSQDTHVQAAPNVNAVPNALTNYKEQGNVDDGVFTGDVQMATTTAMSGEMRVDKADDEMSKGLTTSMTSTSSDAANATSDDDAWATNTDDENEATANDTSQQRWPVANCGNNSSGKVPDDDACYADGECGEQAMTSFDENTVHRRDLPWHHFSTTRDAAEPSWVESACMR